MNKWHGLLVAGALGLGVLSQIPLHDHTALPGHEHDMAATAAPAGLQQVTLAVTGMT